MLDMDIYIVGCGGTGGHFIAGFGEFLKSFKSTAIGWRLTLCDGDIVEEHNLDNQAFVRADVGKNKALVMQEGLEEAFGLKGVRAYGYIDSPADLKGLMDVDKYQLTVIVGCVDNHKARQTMHRVFYDCPNCVYIDSGNDFSAGQICTGVRLHGRDYRPPRGYYFPDVITDRTPTDRELSCGTVNAHVPQHITTNKKAANILLAFMSWFCQEGFKYVTTDLNDILKFCRECGMTTFKAFPPREAYERFLPFEEQCPSREEVMGDAFAF